MKQTEKEIELDEIAQKICSCEKCKDLCKNCTHPVPGEGNSEAELMLVGEAPGAEEDRTGRPFVGAAGRFLEEMLSNIGLKRSDVFITNILKYRPPNNRDPLPDEIKECLPFLIAQIRVIKPKLIVLLGRHAMNVFFPELKISQAHGRPLKRNNQVYLPLYHPAAALYNGSMRSVLTEDFNRIPKILSKIAISSK